MKKASEFATVEELQRPEYRKVAQKLEEIHVGLQLPTHEELNTEQFPWAHTEHPSGVQYAPRLWEYPYAILNADLKPGLRCADVGCGMTPFTVYLKDVAKCDVVGFDSDLYEEGYRFKAFGVNAAFVEKTGLNIVRSSAEKIEAEDNSFDRVFCLSVIEHLKGPVAIKGMQEMARILKPGGLAIITLDVNIFSTLCVVDPLSLVWNSGLVPYGCIDLKWPEKRLGWFCKNNEPADVMGLVLQKDACLIDATVCDVEHSTISQIQRSTVPQLRNPKHVDLNPMSFLKRLKLATKFLVSGSRVTAEITRESYLG